jgi:hypothetical protein
VNGINPGLIYFNYAFGTPVRMLITAIAILLVANSIRSLVIAFRPRRNRWIHRRNRKRHNIRQEGFLRAMSAAARANAMAWVQ